MPDTIRSLSALQALLPDNTSGLISPQDVRDFLVSVMPTGRTGTYVVAASDSRDIEKVNADYLCDGTADEVQIQAAIDALGSTGGTVTLCAGTYTLAAVVTITDNARIKISAYGCRFLLANNITGFRINAGTGGTAKGIVFEGFHIDGDGTITGKTGIEVRDTDRVVLRDFRIEDLATGLLQRSEVVTVGFVEGLKLENGYIGTCTTGWSATVGSGTGSFGETVVDNVHFNQNTTGISWAQNSNFYRTRFSGVTVWVTTGTTGWSIDGNVRALSGNIAFESLALNAGTAITIGTNASNTTLMMLDIDFEGTFATVISDAFSKYIKFRFNGYWMTNHVDAPGSIEARVYGDSGSRFRVIANAAAGGGWWVGNGSADVFALVGEAADLARITGGIQFPEHADFAAPAANYGIQYARDTGGKTEQVERFNSGAIQQVAIEP